jgi:biopolymer transport protein ExbD
MRIKTDEDEDVGIQMAPLIDCVFLLLIFFLVAASLKKAHKELQIDLPHAAASIETKSKYETLIIEITRDGTVHLDAQPVTQRLLHQRLRDAAAEFPDRRVRIDADRATPFQFVVRVIDLCSFYNLNNVGVRTRD